jgi:hypothetical protein
MTFKGYPKKLIRATARQDLTSFDPISVAPKGGFGKFGGKLYDPHIFGI